MNFSLNSSRLVTNAMSAMIAPPLPGLQSGYYMHPLVMDATLHLMAAALIHEHSTIASIMLPVGVDAIASNGLDLKGQVLSLAQPSSTSSTKSVVCQYRMVSNQHNVMHIKDLLAKDAKNLGNAKHKQKSEDLAFPSHKLLYELHWQMERPIHSSPVHNNIVSNVDFLEQYGNGFVIHQPYASRPQSEDHITQSTSSWLNNVPNEDDAAFECNDVEIKRSKPITTTMLFMNRLLQTWQRMSAQWQYKQVVLLTRRHFGTYMARDDSSEYVHEASAALMRVATAENPNMQIACLATDLLAKSISKVTLVKVAKRSSVLVACQTARCMSGAIRNH